MPPKKDSPAASSSPVKLTDNDNRVLAAAWQCLKGGKPQIEYDKLAVMLNLKNKSSASTTFCATYKKISHLFKPDGEGHDASADGDETTTIEATPGKPKASRGKKRGSPGEDGVNGDACPDDGNTTPTPSAKKPRKPRAKKVSVPLASSEAEGNGDAQDQNGVEDIVKTESEATAVAEEVAGECDSCKPETLPFVHTCAKKNLADAIGLLSEAKAKLAMVKAANRKPLPNGRPARLDDHVFCRRER